MANCHACERSIRTHHYFNIQGDGRLHGKQEQIRHYVCTDHSMNEIKQQCAIVIDWAARREFGRAKILHNPGTREVKHWSDEARFNLWQAEDRGEIEVGASRTGLIIVHLMPYEPRNEMLVEKFLTHSNWLVDTAIA